MLDLQSHSSRLHKISIACKTCDVSESFYSSMSIKRFRLDHVGHEVIEGDMETLMAAQRTQSPNVRQDGENGGKVRLLKVLVELVMVPAYPSPVFTITGVKEDFKSAFVQVVSPSQRDQVRETLEKGKYLDSGSNDTVYVWEPRAISFSEDATLAMSLGSTSSVGSKPAEANLATEEAFRGDAPSTSGDAQGIQIAASGGDPSALAIKEVAPQAESPVLMLPPVLSDSRKSLPSPHSSPRPERSSSASARARMSAAATSPRFEPDAFSKPSPESRETPSSARSAGKEAAAFRSGVGSQRGKVEDDNYLLVSRSWYIESGPRNMNEPVRISRLLRPFRWKVEPAYTIGVLVDDILSVETANHEIGADMTKQIEGAGYKLSRVSVERGKPVAWFKRQPASERDSPGC
jgi:hypothetical protein